MNNNGGAISFDAYINNSDFLKSFQEMEARIRSFTTSATQEAKKTDTVFSKLGKAIENTFTSDNLREVAQQIIKVRGEFQALEGSLKVMLGSKEKADELMAQVADLAAKTPLSLTQVGESAKLMVAYGFSTDTVIGHLQMLGDVAHGVNMPIEDLVNTFGAIRTNGVASLSDIEGMAGKGIPIFEVLGNVLNTNRDGVEKMVEASKVGLPQIELAFQSMTSTGGMFSGVMKEQAKSVDALMTNLEESINRVYNEIGKDTDGLVAGTLQMGVSMLENYKSIAKILEVLAIAYGAYKAALLVVNATEAAAIAIKGGWTIATLAEYQALLLVEGAQKVLNATILANPYVAVTTLIIGLASAVYLFNTNTAIAERAQNRYNTELAESNKKINNLKDETNKLNNIIRNNSSAQGEQIKAYKRLQELYPDMLKNIDLYKYKTMDATKSQKEFNAALTGIKIGDTKNKIAEVDKRIADNQKRKSDLFTKPQLGVSGGVTSMQVYLDNQINADKALRNALAKGYVNLRKTQINERKELENEGSVKNKEYWDKELKQLQTEFDKQEKNTKKFLELKATIKKVKKELKSYEVSDSEEDKPHNTPAPKTPAPTAPAPYGSIAYWQEISSKAQYIYEHSNNPSEKTTQIAVVLDAEKKVAEGRKQLEEELSKGKIKTFEEEIEEKKKQYVLYENWVKNIDKKTADIQFKDLLTKGNNYTDYLSKQITSLEGKQHDVNLDPTAKTEAQGNLVKYKIEYQIVTGKKSGVELLKEDMLKAKKEAKSLVEYLEYIEKLKEKLKGDTSTEGIAQTNTLVEETNQTNEQIAANLQEYLRNHETYEEQKDNIIKKHIGLREALESQYTDKTNAEYLKNLEKLKKGKKEELDIIEKTNEEKIAYLKSLQDSLRIIDLKYLKEKVETEKNKLDSLKGKENTDDYTQQLKKVQDAEKNLNDHLLSVVSKFASLGGQLGGVMSKMNGAIGDTGQLLSGLAQNADNVVNAFKKGATPTDKWMTGISATIGLIDLVASSANEREKAEEEYRKNALQFEQDYKVAINERIGAETKTKENVFVKDYAGRLKDGFKMYNDASAKYQESLKKLEQGKAKVGQRNAVDWGKVGSGVAMGAALGTAIVPVIGTAIGAVVGGIIGWFGGKKKKDEFTGLLKEYPELIQKAANGQEIFNKELAETLISNNQVDDATKQLLQDSITWSEQMEKAKGQIKEVIADLAGNLGNNLRDGLVNAFKDGTSAAEAFGKSVSGILEDMLSQLLFNQVFSKAFDDLQEQMMISADLDNGGDNNFIDDFSVFFSQANGLWQQFYDQLDAASASAKSYGLDIFQKNKPASPNSLTGSVKSITEDTAGLLAGNMTQLRVVATSQLISLRNVEVIASQQLTLQAKFLPFLERIDNNLDKLNSGDNILRVKF